MQPGASTLNELSAEASLAAGSDAGGYLTSVPPVIVDPTDDGPG